VRLAVPAGTIVLYDSRLEHRGTANASPRARPTMYFSFQQQRGTVPDGPTFTLRDEYTGALTLFDVVAGRLDARTRDADALRRVLKVPTANNTQLSDRQVDEVFKYLSVGEHDSRAYPQFLGDVSSGFINFTVPDDVMSAFPAASSDR
jgi:hypothetical protein